MLEASSDTVIDQDEFRTVEIGTAFRRLRCYHCSTTAIYKYGVQQIRRTPVLQKSNGEEPTEDDLARWRAIPKFSEIPETVRCKRCGEVLGLHTECIY